MINLKKMAATVVIPFMMATTTAYAEGNEQEKPKPHPKPPHSNPHPKPPAMDVVVDTSVIVGGPEISNDQSTIIGDTSVIVGGDEYSNDNSNENNIRNDNNNQNNNDNRNSNENNNQNNVNSENNNTVNSTNTNTSTSGVENSGNSASSSSVGESGNSTNTIDASNNSVYNSKSGAATGAANAPAIISLKRCVSEVSFGISGGGVFGSYGSLSFGYSPSEGVQIKGKNGQQFLVHEYAKATPTQRGVMTQKMGDSDIETLECVSRNYVQIKEQYENSNGFQMSYKMLTHLLDRKTNVPGKGQGASIEEHFRAAALVAEYSDKFAGAFRCSVTAAAMSGLTGEIDQKDRPTPLQLAYIAIGVTPATADKPAVVGKPIEACNVFIEKKDTFDLN